MTRSIARWKETFAAMPAQNRRLALGGGALVLAILVWGAVSGGSGGDWEAVSGSAYESAELSRAVQLLAERGIRFDPTRDGRLRVPRERKAEALVLLAREDALPKERFGFQDLVSHQPFPTHKQVDYQAQVAFQNEMARTLRDLQEIRDARVILNPGASGYQPFGEPAKPGASVVLTLKRSERLPEEVAQGIRMLVARSWKGLLPENVQILDSRGRGYGAEPEGASGTLLRQKTEYESYLAQKAQRHLEAAYPGAKVVVNVRLRSDEVLRESNRVNPGETVPLRIKTGGGQDEVQNEVSRSFEKTLMKPGAVEEITASAIVPREPDPSAARGRPRFTRLSAAQLGAVRELVAGACGIADPAKVSAVDVDPEPSAPVGPAPEREAPDAAWGAAARQAWPWALGAVLVLALGAALRRQRPAGPALAAASVPAAEGAPPGGQAGRGIAPIGALEDQVRRSVQEDPRVAAAWIRRWARENDET